MSKQIAIFYLLVVVILGLPLVVLPGGKWLAPDIDFKQGLTAFEQGDYAAAARIWGPVAERGNARAQYYLGAMYAYGKGVPRNYQKALAWYGLAAEQGDVASQYNLAQMYRTGRGAPRDDAAAARWYEVRLNRGISRPSIIWV